MKSVLVLLSTYNGEKYIREQIDSLLNQENVQVSILARDDGSKDSTVEILEEYKKTGRLDWYNGGNKGPGYSFFDLIYHAERADYYAFCDQDDFWLQDKLSIAVNKLDECDDSKANLYYGCPRFSDENLNYIEVPKLQKNQSLILKAAIVDSTAAGCTMVFNNCMRDAIVGKELPKDMIMHDDWLHKLCLILKGNLIYDPDVHMKYRQHTTNVGGTSVSKFTKIKRRLFNKDCKRSKQLASMLNLYGDEMNEDDKHLIEMAANYKQGFKKKCKLFFTGKIKTNHFTRNVVFKLMVQFGTY